MSGLTHWGKIDRGARGISPVVVSLLLVVVSMVPLQVRGFGMIMPSVALMAAFYWAVYRPDLFGPGAAVALGFLHDVFSGAPLGLNALLCVAAYATVVRQRQLFLAHTFPVLWWGYALLAFLVAVVVWVIYSLVHLRFIPLEPALFQALAGVALFPPVVWVLNRVQRGFLGSL